MIWKILQIKYANSMAFILIQFLIKKKKKFRIKKETAIVIILINLLRVKRNLMRNKSLSRSNRVNHQKWLFKKNLLP